MVRFLGFAAILFASAYAAWSRLGRPRTGIDDAAIVLCYAQSLSLGQGLVYGAGGVLVEGFSSWI